MRLAPSRAISSSVSVISPACTEEVSVDNLSMGGVSFPPPASGVFVCWAHAEGYAALFHPIKSRDPQLLRIPQRHRSSQFRGRRKYDEKRNAIRAVGKPLKLILLVLTVYEPPDDRQPPGRQLVGPPIQVKREELVVGWREQSKSRRGCWCERDKHRYLRVEAE